jgi:sulfur carrier protein
MITIYLNSTRIELIETLTLKEVLEKNGHASGTFAIAINRQFIPRGQYEKTSVKEGDQIDVIVPMQGG